METGQVLTTLAELVASNTTIANKQDKLDNTLNTTDKTVSGAINEINSKETTNETNISSHISNTSNPHNTSIDNLQKVNITSPINKQQLGYDSSSNKWINQDNVDEKVKINAISDSKYLGEWIDGISIQNVGGKVVAKSLDGLQVTLNEMNYLSGLNENIMTKFSSIINGNGGIEVYKNGIFGTYANLLAFDFTTLTSGKTYLMYVSTDEVHNGNGTTYMSDSTTNNTSNLPKYCGLSSATQRILTIDKVDLANETKGILAQSSMDMTDIVKTTTLANYETISDLQANYATISQVGSKISTTDADAKYELKNAMLVKPNNYLYVAKNGLDTNDGSASNPFLTIQKAIDTATSGTTIFIFPASYSENIALKANVMLTSPVKFGVTITGNHIANFAGTVVCDNITFNSTSGNTLSFNGIGIQNLQLIGSSVNSINGDAINYTNTNASSRIYFEDGTCNVATSGTNARCFCSSSTAKGKLIANRVSFGINNPDNVCLSINGAISFTHTSDVVVGQAVVSNTASYTSAMVSHTTNSVPSVITNSTGLTTMLNCIQIGTSIPMVAGAGLFAESAILYPSTGKGTASTLNGGLGANIINMSSIKLRGGTLKTTVQDGLIEYDNSNLYFSIGTVRDKIATMGNIPNVTNKLEATNIKAGTNVIVTTNGNDVTISSSGGTGVSTWNTFNL